MKKIMMIVDYNPNWEFMFIEEKNKLTSIFGDLIKSIHHIGSTAIRTTKAKPEIDILIIVNEDKNLAKYDQDMINLGYRVRGECLENGGSPGRYYYSKDINNIRTHKVHICKTGHKEIIDKLVFCKYLNEHNEYGKNYALIKEKLCKEYGYRDIQKYLKGKEDFINSTIKIAKQKYKDINESDFVS